MSATLDAGPVARFLGAASLRSEGRRFDVAVEHLSPEEAARPDVRLEEAVARAVRRLHREGMDGDVLVFLPGAAEIRRSREALAEWAAASGVDLLPLHGDLPPDEQDRAVRPGPRRKVILSTNVAETSVTIEGVVAVVDSGLARVASHSPWSGLPTLEVRKVSRASAAQRAGRAGRTRPGRALRLYTRHDHDARPEFDVPEVLREDLSETLLAISALGAADGLAWLEPPPAAALDAARALLLRLGAVDARGDITETGRRMLRLPVHPRLARLAIEAAARGAADGGALVAAILGERDLRDRRALDGGALPPTGPSDLLELAHAFEEAARVRFAPERLRRMGLNPAAVQAVERSRRQLQRTLRSLGPTAPPTSAATDQVAAHPERSAAEGGAESRDAEGAKSRDAASAAERRRETPEEHALLLATLAAYPDRVARRRSSGSDEVVLVGGGSARLDPASVVREAALLVAIDAEERRGDRRAPGARAAEARVRLASAATEEMLLDLFPEALRYDDAVQWNAAAERVEAAERLVYEDLVLEETRASRPDPEQGRRAPRRRGARARAARVRSGGRARPARRADRLRGAARAGRGARGAVRGGARRGAERPVRRTAELRRAARGGPAGRAPRAPRSEGARRARAARAGAGDAAGRAQHAHQLRGRQAAVDREPAAGLLRPRAGPGARRREGAARPAPPRPEPARGAGDHGSRWVLGAALPVDPARARPAVSAPRLARGPAQRFPAGAAAVAARPRPVPSLRIAALGPRRRRTDRSTVAPRRSVPPYRPQLALLVAQAPAGDGWVHEVKYDGYRIGCAIEGGKVTLWSRRGKDWTAQFPEVATAARKLKVRAALLDGEVAAVLPDGRTSFQALQNAFAARRRELVYFAFDLLHLDGEDLLERPLLERKAALARVVGEGVGVMRYAPHFEGDGRDVHREACRLGLEGIVSKRSDLPYRPGRNATWVKTKCMLRQELVIGGFTDPEGAARDGIGALLVGYREGDALRFAGQGRDGVHERERPRAPPAPRPDRAGGEPVHAAARGVARPERALGSARARLRGRLHRVDAGRQDPAPVVPGAPGGQATRGRGPGAARHGGRPGRDQSDPDVDRDGPIGRSSRA